MGTHPLGESKLDIEKENSSSISPHLFEETKGSQVPLKSVLKDQDLQDIPFLFKVLSVNSPLSI